MKIVFFGTPDFVIPITQSLLSTEDCKLCAVVTNPDRPVGRKQILTPSPVKKWALAHLINVINDDTVIRIAVSLKKLKPDLGVLAAYGKIIPQEIIDLFPKGILVIHPSLLPKYRGASPIQAAIFSGDKETGVSIIQMDSKMDHGPIVAQFREKIKPDETAETLTKRLFLKTAPYLIKIIMSKAKLIGDRSFIRRKALLISDIKDINIIQPIPQNHALATFTKLLTKDDGFINLASQGQALRAYNFIRAMSPWPGAWTMVSCHSRSNRESSVSQRHSELGSESVLDPRFGSTRLTILSLSKDRGDNNKLRLKILKAHLEKEKLVLDEVQLEGKKPVSWNEFQKGYPKFSFLKTCPGRE